MTANTKRFAHIVSHYSPRLHSATEHYDVLDWASQEAQVVRFDVLVQIAKQTIAKTAMSSQESREMSILDVGCGLTDLATHLQTQNLAMKYTGLELVPDMAIAAHKKFPDRSLVVADIVETIPFKPDAFDFVFCSGVFNLETGDNSSCIAHALSNIAVISKTCAVINFLHNRTRDKYPHCHYYQPEEILGLATRLGKEAKILDDYLENDFTLVMS
jgi:SAM-dependent methyltransferase